MYNAKYTQAFSFSHRLFAASITILKKQKKKRIRKKKKREQSGGPKEVSRNYKILALRRGNREESPTRREKKLSKHQNRRIFQWRSLPTLRARPLRKKFEERIEPINPAPVSTLTTIHPDQHQFEREIKRGNERRRRSRESA